MQYSSDLRHPLPDFLKDKCSKLVYYRWISKKADSLLRRDQKRNKLCARGATETIYADLIHKAVLAGGLNDPYTGEEMRWDLIGTWDPDKAHKGGDYYKREYALFPTADHIDPNSETLTFEICSWQINDCKTDLNPAEFVSICSKVAAYRQLTNKKKDST